MRPLGPRVLRAAVELAARGAGEDRAGGGLAEETGVAEDPPHHRRAVAVADEVEEVPVLDPVADLFEARARARGVLARVDQDELAVLPQAREDVVRVVRGDALAVERPRNSFERIPEQE